MNAQAAGIYYENKEYDTSKERAKAYLKGYVESRKKLNVYAEELLFFLGNVFSDGVYASIVSLLIYLEGLEDKWDTFDKCFNSLNWTSASGYDFLGHEAKLLELMADIDYDDRFRDMMKAFWDDPVSRNLIRKALEGISLSEKGRRWNLVKAISNVEVLSPTPWDLYILWEDHLDHRVDYEQMFIQLFRQSNPLEQEHYVWEIAKKRDVNLSKVISKTEFPKWRRCVDEFCDSYKGYKTIEIKQIIEDLLTDENVFLSYAMFRLNVVHLGEYVKHPDRIVKTNTVNESRFNIITLNPDKDDNFRWMHNELASYVHNCNVYYQKICINNKDLQKKNYLPDEYRLALHLSNIFDISNLNYKIILATLKEAIGIYPMMDDAIREYSHLYAKWVKKNLSDSPKDEMEELLSSLERKIQELIKDGRKDEAEAILKEIKKYSVFQQ